MNSHFRSRCWARQKQSRRPSRPHTSACVLRLLRHELLGSDVLVMVRIARDGISTSTANPSQTTTRMSTAASPPRRRPWLLCPRQRDHALLARLHIPVAPGQPRFVLPAEEEETEWFMDEEDDVDGSISESIRFLFGM
ncbi:unnamed protein product [Urochloa humidicola]